MKTYADPFLNSLFEVFQKNPHDITFKKYFGMELFKKGEFQDAYILLKEVSNDDKDINVEKTLNDIRTKISPNGEISEDHAEEAQSQTINNSILFADVAGMEQVKDAIRTDIIYPYQHPEIYKQYNKIAGGGILLYGPPGCGKTYIAKATAGEMKAKFYSIQIHEVLSYFHGEGEQTLHQLFQIARQNKPTVLFLDEIDAIGMNREKTSPLLRTLVNQFLIELDGVDSNNDGVLVIGATNLPWEVDSALRRPGRFDKIIFVPPPDKQARTKIFEMCLDGKPHEEIHFEELAKLTAKFSSADINRICDEAGERAFKEAVKSGKTVPITQQSLVEIAQHMKSSISDWFLTVGNYIKYSNDSGFYNTVKEYLDTVSNE
jgi:transitional endoplasmic reticulum ATPase